MDSIIKIKNLANNIRLYTLKEFRELGFGHVGGCMSIVELLAVLYGKFMNIDPTNSKEINRDWLILSKGHAGPVLYATLALKGFINKSDLSTLNKNDSNLPSHVNKNKTNGIDISAGSLGQGVSNAVGVALSHKINNRNNYTFLITGDGELNEGQVWEGAMFAAHYKLKKLIWFVDFNKKQLDGYINDILNPFSLYDKFNSFGFFTQEIDGHNISQIINAINIAQNKNDDRPSCIILNTIKGKGCSFVEKEFNNHSSTFEYEVITKEIDKLIKLINN